MRSDIERRQLASPANSASGFCSLALLRLAFASVGLVLRAVSFALLFDAGLFLCCPLNLLLHIVSGNSSCLEQAIPLVPIIDPQLGQVLSALMTTSMPVAH